MPEQLIIQRVNHEVESQDGLRISIEIYAKEEDLYAKEEDLYAKEEDLYAREEGYIRGKENGRGRTAW